MVPGKNRPAASAAENHTSLPTLLCAALMNERFACLRRDFPGLAVCFLAYPNRNLFQVFRDMFEFLHLPDERPMTGH
jgi:hypothetical protein